jgi:hypothetical protein
MEENIKGVSSGRNPFLIWLGVKSLRDRKMELGIMSCGVMTRTLVL